MAGTRTLHVCESCGHQSPKWLGRCPSCNEYNTFAEQTVAKKSGGSRGTLAKSLSAAPIVRLDQVQEGGADGADGVGRFTSGMERLDRVLGGGVVHGGAVLLAGEPGIGKSTLLLQLGDALARGQHRVIYVSAEESPRQLKLRSERLGASNSALGVIGETSLEPILAAVEKAAPEILCVDSVQALRSADLDGPPGSVGQVRHCADRLVELCKRREIALFLVGHVTKEGAIAGPKSLEHLVDTVLTFEGEAQSEHRILRAQKNRFGPTGEVALYAMHDDGLEEVSDPSRVLLARRRGGRPGSVVSATLHGSRPLLVEVQALVHPTSFPSPRRMSVGLDGNRVTLLVAVLERFVGLGLADRDLFLNVVGGLAVREPAADLAVAAAILSAFGDRALPDDAALFGEVGLLGEVRPVARSQARLREIAALGFRRVYCPPLEGASREAIGIPPDLLCIEIEDIVELARHLAPNVKPSAE